MSELDSLIQEISKKTLVAFCRTKSGDFRPSEHSQITAQTPELFPKAYQENFSSIDIVGYFKDLQLFIFAIKLNDSISLSERSCRRKQYDYAKLVLRAATNAQYANFTNWLGEEAPTGRINQGLFVFCDTAGCFRFSLVEDLNPDEEASKRFRRYTFFVDPEQTNRTFKDRMATPWTSFENLKDAFSVEALNKEFYNRLFAWYEWACSDSRVEYPNDTAVGGNNRHDINQHMIRLITRLIFVWFLKQKKLVPETLFDENVLENILRDFDPVSKKQHNYYRAILQNLFFATLNKEISERSFAHSSGPEQKYSNDHGIKDKFRYQNEFKLNEQEVLDIFSAIPFLNGGLFECLDHCKEDKVNKKEKEYYVDGFSQKEYHQERNTLTWAHIPNEFFFSTETWKRSELSPNMENVIGTEKGLIPLLKQYNFTIDENANDDESQEVALDPELLGRVFENLLASYNPETKETARRSTGSFYTPREIVNYMVDESLKAYLLEKCGSEHEEATNNLFSKEPQTSLDSQFAKKVRQALNEIKVLDPACGSGAFPMGMLHRLLDLHSKLHKVTEAANPYQLKLNIIENCIYGVDIQPIAVQISKLRFFISLICEQNEEEIQGKTAAENYGIRALPNLETKFVAANSLIGLKRDTTKGQCSLPMKEVEQTKNKLWKIRHQLFAAESRNQKLELRKKDKKLREELASSLKGNGDFDVADAEKMADWDPYNQNTSSSFFDPEWMFNINEGFDIVIGNPPYVDSETMTNTDPALRNELRNLYSTARGNWDLFVIFIERSTQLVSQRGHIGLIIPNKLISATYTYHLREYLSKLAIKEIRDYSHTTVFQDVSVYPITILIQQKTTDQKPVLIIRMHDIKSISTRVSIPYCDFSADIDWSKYFHPENVSSLLIKLRTLPKLSEHEVEIHGAATVAEAYRIKEQIINSQTAQGKRLVNTGTIDPYCSYWGEYPIRYIKGQYMFPVVTDEALRQISETRAEQSSAEKLIIAGMGKRVEVVLDSGCLLAGKTTTIVLGEHTTLKALLGILNSSVITFYLNAFYHSLKMAGGYINIGQEVIKSLPIPKLCDRKKKLITQMVDNIISVKNKNLSADISRLQSELDEELIYSLYGLTDDEKTVIKTFLIEDELETNKSQVPGSPIASPVTSQAQKASAKNYRD